MGKLIAKAIAGHDATNKTAAKVILLDRKNQSVLAIEWAEKVLGQKAPEPKVGANSVPVAST